MGTRPLLEARPSLAARNQLLHDWECAEEEGETIYFTPLPELVFLARTIHRTYGAQTKVCATGTRRLISIAAASA
jgi:hypothetical protein